MPKKFYIDTAVWRDYFEDRKDGIRPLGEFSFQFLAKCLKKKAGLVVSDIVVKELEIDFSEEQLKIMFSEFKDILIKVQHTKKQAAEAFALLRRFKRNFPLADILHSVIARDEGAILITRDNHFLEINLVEVHAPEELI